MSLMPASSVPDIPPTIQSSLSRSLREAADSVDNGSVQSQRSLTNSPLPPPSKGGGGGAVARPPGLDVIDIRDQSFTGSTSSTTAQGVTLTPTSSIDGGGSDMYSLGGKQSSSPFRGDAPPMPDASELPPGIGNMGSFDSSGTGGGHRDGLLGLQALGGDGQLQRRASAGVKMPPASRPPLSGTGAVGDSRYDQGNANRRRSISTETGKEFAARDPHGFGLGGPRMDRHYSLDHLSQNFSNLSAVGPQFDEQQNFQSQPRPPHFQMRQRAVSHPNQLESLQHGGNEYGVGMDPNMYGPAMENEYIGDGYGGHQYQQHHQRRGQRGRRMSFEPSMLQQGSNSFDGAVRSQRRSSLQAIPGEFDGAGSPVHGVHRRTMYGGQQQPRYANGGEDRRTFAGLESDHMGYPHHERMATPDHSPLHNSYAGAGHSRHPSDMSRGSLATSPMSHLNAEMRGAHGQYHDGYGHSGRGSLQHRGMPSEDDFGLVGEHIDVPGDDNPYSVHEGGIHPLHRSQTRPNRGRGGSMDRQHHYGADDTHHLPTAGGGIPMPKAVYNVKFKRTQRSFALGPRLNRDLKVGTYVKVEADRGEDLGIVVGKLPPEKYMSGRLPYRAEAGLAGPSGPVGVADLKRIIRLATHDEVSLLGIKREEEEELLNVCRTKSRQRGLPMHVVDAEYQFDRHKLTFFFEADGRVDFRELVRDLFSIYKTRIWMQQLDKSSSATCPTAEETPQPLMMDYGTPIIAPESEFSEFAALNSSSGDAASDND